MTHTTMNELALTTTEAALRDKCLAVIRAHRDGFIAAGEALATMRDSRLYRETHATFEEFCREELGISDRRARQLMVAAEIGTTVPKITTESQARELARVEPEQRQAVIAKAQEATGGKITAAAIREAARPERTPEPQVIEMTPAPAPKISTATMTEAVHLWVMAKSKLDNIRRNDPERLNVLREVVSYAQARINNDN